MTSVAYDNGTIVVDGKPLTPTTKITIEAGAMAEFVKTYMQAQNAVDTAAAVALVGQIEQHAKAARPKAARRPDHRLIKAGY